MTGTVRFDLVRRRAHRALVLADPQGGRVRRARGRRGRLCAQRRHRHVRRDPRRPHERHGRPAARRGRASRASVFLLTALQRLFPGASDVPDEPRRRLREEAVMSDEVKILDGNTFVVSDEARRHRGVADRSDGPVLVRHAVPLHVGAHRRRPAAQPAVRGRPAVLRDALLPRAGHRDRLHRRQAVGHPPARRRRGLPRGAHDPQPRREARPTSRCVSRPARDFADLFEVKDALKKKGEYYTQRRRRPAGARLPARDLRARDLDLGDRSVRRRRARPDVQRPRRAARRVDDRSARDARARRRRAEHRPAQVRAPREGRAAHHGAQPGEVAGRGAHDWPATGTRSSGRTSAASSTWRRCGSRPCRCPATTCRRPGCRGS